MELMIVMLIIGILATMAIPIYTRNVQAAKEAVLREDLQVMRTAIGSYTVDKQKAPQSLEDLVSGGYLKAIPKDPITGRTDTWITAQSDTLSTVDQTEGGIDDVHSGAQDDRDRRQLLQHLVSAPTGGPCPDRGGAFALPPARPGPNKEQQNGAYYV